MSAFFIPEVRVADFVAGARSARGLAVVIDVFRAFSVAAYAHAWGAREIIPVASIDDARALKAANPDAILLGERHARKLPGFDCGNSPAELQKLDVRGRTLIHTTHSGTQGLTNALAADEVITGALVNAGAIVSYIRSRRPSISGTSERPCTRCDASTSNRSRSVAWMSTAVVRASHVPAATPGQATSNGMRPSGS